MGGEVKEREKKWLRPGLTRALGREHTQGVQKLDWGSDSADSRPFFLPDHAVSAAQLLRLQVSVFFFFISMYFPLNLVDD